MMKTTRKPTEVPAALKNINLEQVLRKRNIYKLRQINREYKAAVLPIAKKMLAKKPVTKAEVQTYKLSNEMVREYYDKQIHLVETVEQHLHNKLVQFIQEVGQDFLKSFDEEVKSRKSFVKFVQKDYFSDNEEALNAKAQLDFTPLLENVAVLAGNEAYKLLKMDTPYLVYNFRRQIEQNVAKFTQSMLQTDRDKLSKLIADGLEQGQSIPEIRSAIETNFVGNYSKTQADRITKTEVIRVSNQAALDAYKESGVVEARQWVAFNSVDECADYDGKIEKLDANFYPIESEFMDGDPPLHPNCKCVIIPVVGGEL